MLIVAGVSIKYRSNDHTFFKRFSLTDYLDETKTDQVNINNKPKYTSSAWKMSFILGI